MRGYQSMGVVSGLLSVVLMVAGQGLVMAGASKVVIGKKGEVRVNGKAFLPIFVWAQPRKLIPFHHKMGINTIVPGEKAEKEGGRKAMLDDLAARNMFCLLDAGEYTPELAQHPALLCWKFGDEPDMAKPGPMVYDFPEGTIFIEGEKPTTRAWPEEAGFHKPHPRLSGTKWLSVYAKTYPDKPYGATYAFDVAKAGAYVLFVREFNKRWANPTRWRLDQGEWQETSREMACNKVENIGGGRGVGWCRYAKVDLTAGKHTLAIEVAKGRTCGKPAKVSDNVVAGYDAFLFSPTDAFPVDPTSAPVPKHPPEALVAKYKELTDKDPNHPKWINLTPSFFGNYYVSGRKAGRVVDLDTYRRFGEACDVISFDHYPVTGWNKPDRVPELYFSTKQFVELYPDKAHWVIVENADQDLAWTPKKTRGPTAQETRAMVWMCLIAGAKGIGYFPVAFNPFRWTNLTDEMKQEMPRLNREITELAPVLLEGDLLAATSDNEQVKARALQHGGKSYVFAVNLTTKEQTSKIAAPDLIAKALYARGKVDAIPVAGGAFSLKLGPLERVILTEEMQATDKELDG